MSPPQTEACLVVRICPSDQSQVFSTAKHTSWGREQASPRKNNWATAPSSANIHCLEGRHWQHRGSYSILLVVAGNNLCSLPGEWWCPLIGRAGVGKGCDEQGCVGLLLCDICVGFSRGELPTGMRKHLSLWAALLYPESSGDLAQKAKNALRSPLEVWRSRCDSHKKRLHPLGSMCRWRCLREHPQCST